MNRVELREAVKQRAGIAFDNAATDDAVNEALQEVATERDWEYLHHVWRFATTAGRSSYSLPYRARGVISVNVGGSDVPYIGGRDSDEGQTVGYTIEGNELVITPLAQTAGAQVIVRMVRDEEELSHNAAEPLLPATYHRAVLVNRAAAILLENRGEHQRADRLRADAERGVSRMVRTGRKRKGPGRIRVRPGGPV